jgi:hypothetical protein
MQNHISLHYISDSIKQDYKGMNLSPNSEGRSLDNATMRAT